jgi:hypothetical protein
MPDHNAQAKAAYAEHLRDMDLPHNAHLRAQAIVNCGLCDDEGYRGVYVCDHIDHAAETEHGRALVKAELERIRNKRLAGER